MSISDISRTIGMSRNTVAKYINSLLITGQVSMRTYGMAKVFTLSERVPLSAMLNFTSDSIIVLDNELKILQVNDTFINTFKKSRDDLIGHNLSEINRIGFFEYVLPMLKDGIEGKPSITDYSQKLDEKNACFRLRVVPTVFDTGNVGVTLVVIDTTREKMFELKFKKNEELFRNLFEQSVNLLFITNPDGKILDANGLACEMLGYEHAQMDDIAFDQLVPLPERERCRESLEAQKKSGNVRFESKLMQKSGETIDVNISLNSIDENRRLIQVIVRDIATLKPAEKQIRIQHDLAASLNRTTSTDEIIPLCVRAAIDISGMEVGSFFIFNTETNDFSLRYSTGLSSEFVEVVLRGKYNPAALDCENSGKPMFLCISDMTVPVQGVMGSEGLSSLAIIPVMFHNRMVGALSLESQTLTDVPCSSRKQLEIIAVELAGSIIRLTM